MKKLFTILLSFVVISSCSTTKEANSSRAELRKEKKLVDQAVIKNAVESKRYIIKFDRIYLTYGGIRELIPRANFLIVDREKAILNTAYLGRQFDIKPISAINIRGRAVGYAVTDNLSKGSYEVKMKVNNGGSNTFDVFITISKNGYCSISVSSLKIDNVTYYGYLVPITDKTNTPPQEGNPI
ncbi:MAG: DUF4251 domain-containing protein [Bacteroidales bacterium]|jgi:hypothetical protein